MINGQEMPEVEPGRFSAPPEQKGPGPSSCLTWGSTIAGGLIFLIGCVVAFGAASIQFERNDDPEGFTAFMLLCPTPLIIVGIVILIAGLLPLARRRQVEDR